MKKLLIIMLLSGTTLSQLNAGEHDILGFSYVSEPMDRQYGNPSEYPKKEVGPITEEAHNKNEATKELTAGYNALLLGDFKNVPSHYHVEQFLSAIGKQQEQVLSVAERRMRTVPQFVEAHSSSLAEDFSYTENYEIALKTFENNPLIKTLHNKLNAVEVADVYFSGWHPYNASYQKVMESHREILINNVYSLWVAAAKRKQQQAAKELNEVAAKIAAEGISINPSSAEFQQVARKPQPSGAATLETSTK